LIEFGQLVLEKKIFKNFQCIFTLSLLSPLRVKGYPLHLKKLKSPPSKNDLCQVWLKLVMWFRRRRFVKDPTPFLHFRDYLPFEEDMALYLNKLEFPSPKDNLYQVWLNLASCFWRTRFLKIFSVFLLFCWTYLYFNLSQDASM
jgi:hypothetical protein